MSSLAELAFEHARQRDERGERSELRARGVVATPVELARYAVARVDQLLRSELGLAHGLASERVVVIDPAVGTGVWLAAVLEQTRARTMEPRSVIGIDVVSETLARTHALLEAEALRQAVKLELRQANTLELARVLGEDDTRIPVILGNPPWAARSLSRGGALSDRWLGEFRRDHEGQPLGERRVGVLSDDYVRFFRWGLEQARHASAGALLCLATNASFLDGPVHRGMRAGLVAGFDRLELLDLGGNALLSGDGGHDENVFGVRVGAALSWAVRRPGTTPRHATVSFAALRGKLSEKLTALAQGAPRMSVVAPSAPWFRFRPTSASSAESAGFSLAEAFVLQREGVQTNRDTLCIASSRSALEAQLRAFVRGELAVARSRHFDPERVRPLLAEALERAALPIEALAYRPLDARFVAAWAPLCHRPRPELLRAVARSELCLLAVRKERGAAPFNLFAPAVQLADGCFLSVRSSCRTRVFPSHDAEGRENLAPAVADKLARCVGRQVTGRELILYALSLLGSPRHRARHEEQLKLDYPVLPWPRGGEQFARALAVGERFVAALCGSSPDPAIPFAVHAPEGALLDLKELRFEPATRTLSHQRTLMISELDEAWWGARVGHHALVFSALRAHAAPSLGQLVSALQRAASWTRAERAADRWFAESSQADATAR